MEAVIFMGLQGAGKSTFYRERFFGTHVRINFDMLKTRHRERRFLQTVDWEECDRPAETPATGEKTFAPRRRIRRNLELPIKDEYSAFLRRLIAEPEGRIHP